MRDKYDPVPDLAWLPDSALVFNGTDAHEAARRIAGRLGISEDDRDGAAERALREALGQAPGEPCELVRARDGSPCTEPAAAALTGACPCGHVTGRRVCEGHRVPVENLWCRACYQLPEPRGHKCPVALIPAAAAPSGPKPFRIRISPAHLATVDRPANLGDPTGDTVADTLGNWWHVAPPSPKAACSNCGADLTWAWDTSAWARAGEPERGREICRWPDGTWKPHAVSTEAAAAAGEGS